VFYGEYLENAEGEDVVSGIRTPEPLAYLQQNYPELYQQLFKIQKDLETHYRDMQAGGRLEPHRRGHHYFLSELLWLTLYGGFR
jgi:phosphoenolpyruvate synthase/pyruvate phosphate dikinase